MLNVDEALKILDDADAPPAGLESVKHSQCLGRILAQPVRAAVDDPGFDNSAMDGYICLESDLDAGVCTFTVDGEIRPEDRNPNSLQPGSAAYITTGSKIPMRGLFVIPVELTETVPEGRIRINRIPSRNAIRNRGEGYQKGRDLMPAGRQISAVDLGLIQFNGYDTLPVLRQLKIAVQATGNELNDRINTNSPVLAALLAGDPLLNVETCPVVRDDRGAMERQFRSLIDNFDIVVTTGGVSAGTFDLVIPAMTSLGVEYSIRKVNQKPGKPFSYGRCGSTDIFSLPGNPVSAIFCMVLYVKRRIRRRLGLEPQTASAILQNSYRTKGERTEFVPGSWRLESEESVVSTDASIQSHLIHRLSERNCFVRMEPGETRKPGDRVTIIPYSGRRI